MDNDCIWHIAQPLLTRKYPNKAQTGRRFKSMFGVSPSIASILWKDLQPTPSDAKPCHLLWALLFLKVYATEHVHAALCQVDEKTFRKWTWIMITWNRRFDLALRGANILVSLDGTDFVINEPTPFDRKWWSHKFNKSALRYELGICIRSGHIVWVNGSKPAGEWSDLKLAREAYVMAVLPGEMTLADKGYMDRDFFVNPTYNPESASIQKKIMARHETANARLKQFGVLKCVYRHRIEDHMMCFLAVANTVQVCIENESPLYSVVKLIDQL
ncbi:hypothetical protein AC1031_011321 [Aphanomyces cochlioides]|nr:hypothetical protein AC1031_011321 [Aphanomyces cochlioides]